MKTRVMALLLTFACAFPLYGQDCGPDWRSGTGTASAYWVEVDGARASSHTNLATALRALADSVRFRPAADVHVRSDFRGVWRGPCGEAGAVDTVVVTDTVEIQLPPDTVFVTDTVEVGDAPTLPAGAPPTPAEMYAAGYAVGDGTQWTEHGVHVFWQAAPVDSFVVEGSRFGGGDAWRETVHVDHPGTYRPVVLRYIAFRRPLTYTDTTTLVLRVTPYRHGLTAPPAVDTVAWAPMARPEPPPPDTSSIRLVWGRTWDTRQGTALTDGIMLPSSFWWGILTPDTQPGEVECWVDGTLQRRETGAPYDCRGTPTPGWPLSAGEHTFRVRLVNSAGSVYAERSVTATVVP